MALFAELQAKKAALRAVPEANCNDRSTANVALAGKDVLDDEAERWEYFFNSGCSAWFDSIQQFTFSSSFCKLLPDEAQVIVDHWEARLKLLARGAVETEVQALVTSATENLENLQARLERAIQAETKRSSASLAFVKLSTRSPKDSKKALLRAKRAYEVRLAELSAKLRAQGCVEAEVPENTRWRILSEEVTAAGAVDSSPAALDLLLDSERVYEDLEYALRGPPTERGAQFGSVSRAQRHWNVSLVARAWDPRLTPESEFRGICWGGRLTCLCQYFHPLHFPELVCRKAEIERDVKRLVAEPDVLAAFDKLGGHCIVDFAWLGPGEVIIVELNPFDGVCLGTFPSSTGLFLWDVPADQAVMKGEAPFEFRIREEPLETSALKNQCNPGWRTIIYATR